MLQKVRRNPKTMTGFDDVRDQQSERSFEEALVTEAQCFCGFVLLNKGHDVMGNL